MNSKGLFGLLTQQENYTNNLLIIITDTVYEFKKIKY